MATKIEWCDETWNPVTGCTPASEGCRNCYAERMFRRNLWGYDFTPGTFHENRLNQPMHWRRPRRIFVCSMGDLFHASVSTRSIYDVLEIVETCQQHTFILLTKRPERMARVEGEWIEDSIANDGDISRSWIGEMPNLWCGATTENQARYDARFNHLQKQIVFVRFISAEPLLGPIDLGPLRFDDEKRPYLDWVICGAETGPGKRPMNLDWARSLRDQCINADVPFFFKKDSDGNKTLDGETWHQYP